MIEEPNLNEAERQELAQWWLGQHDGGTSLPDLTDGIRSWSADDIAAAIIRGETAEDRGYIRDVLRIRNPESSI